MFFEDLSTYQYGRTEPQLGVVNVGWLSRDHAYTQGSLPTAALDALRVLVQTPVNLYRGVHYCEFCPGPTIARSDDRIKIVDPPKDRIGNGEIRVPSGDGTIYVAPILILHYVLEHRYLPPLAFIHACVAHAGGRIDF